LPTPALLKASWQAISVLAWLAHVTFYFAVALSANISEALREPISMGLGFALYLRLGELAEAK
jgi:hypothetical protein